MRSEEHYGLSLVLGGGVAGLNCARVLNEGGVSDAQQQKGDHGDGQLNAYGVF